MKLLTKARATTTQRAGKRRRMILPATLLVVLFAMISGCFYRSGSPLGGKTDFRKTANGTGGVGGFQLHKTTRGDVEAALGPPWHVSPDGQTVVYTMTLDGYAAVPLCFQSGRHPSDYAMAIHYAPDDTIDRYKIENDSADEVTPLGAPIASFWEPLERLTNDRFDMPRLPWVSATRPSTAPGPDHDAGDERKDGR